MRLLGPLEGKFGFGGRLHRPDNARHLPAVILRNIAKPRSCEASSNTERKVLITPGMTCESIFEQGRNNRVPVARLIGFEG